jgi:hypothetical protein
MMYILLRLGAGGLRRYFSGMLECSTCLTRRTGVGILVLAGLSFVGDPASLFLQVGPGAGSAAFAQQVQPLSANDVSWLFPPPVRAEDFDTLISIRDLMTFPRKSGHRVMRLVPLPAVG